MKLKGLKNLIIECIVEESEESDPYVYSAFKGNMFSVDINSEKSQEIINHINDWIIFKKEKTGLAWLLPFKIIHLQKNYKGDVCYRVENQLNTFGFPVGIDNVEKYISEKDAEIMWRKNYLTYVFLMTKSMGKYKHYIDKEFIPFKSKW